MTDFTKLENRYKNDSAFYTLVNLIYNQLELTNYTPQEARDAAMLASIKFEMLHIRSILLVKT